MVHRSIGMSFQFVSVLIPPNTGSVSLAELAVRAFSYELQLKPFGSSLLKLEGWFKC